IHFQKAECLEVVLIPFEVGTVFHTGIDDRTQFMQLALGDDKSARMLPQLPWKPHVLPRQFQHLAQEWVIGIEALFDQQLRVYVIVPMAADRSGKTTYGIQ